MRLIVCIAVALGALLPACWAAAQSEPGPTLSAPPTIASAPASAAPLPTPTAASAPASEPPSEPWMPPAGTTDAAAPAVAPTAELPLPGAGDPAAAAAIADPATKVLIEEPPGGWYSPRVWFGPSPWDSGVELGVNGSSGTSDSFSIRTGAYIKRESRFSKLDFDTAYNLTIGDGITSQNNAKLDLTNDWLLDDKSPWTLFAKMNVFYDRFATFDIQTNLNSGFGYRFVHTPELEIMTRLGGGAQREFGGDDNEWVPESLVGLEYTQRVTKTQKLYSKVEYFPEWREVGEFRAVADAGWEIELVQPSNVSLKLSASDRYDSTPDGVSPHLLNYSVLLLLKM